MFTRFVTHERTDRHVENSMPAPKLSEASKLKEA